MTYRRIVELRSPSNGVSASVQNGNPESSSPPPEVLGSGTKRREGNREDGPGEDEIRNYTRVHILTRAADTVLESRNRVSELREARLGKRPELRKVLEEIVAPSTSPRRMMTIDTNISAQRHFEVSNSMVVGSESISVMSSPQTRRPAMAGLITTGVFMAGGGYDKF